MKTSVVQELFVLVYWFVKVAFLNGKNAWLTFY